jgi:membrane-bound lytic murein transglycosylase D
MTSLVQVPDVNLVASALPHRISYNPKMTEQQRLVLRIARIFGECEVDMPPDFQSEVERYIAKWKSSGRKSAIDVTKQNGYTDTIAREMLATGLPPQFFYRTLQESNFNALQLDR